MELAKAYDPKEAEQSHYERWESSGFFAPEINKDPTAEPYSIVIPPPNVTGSLHMGHALQHTLMDVLARWKRMQGYRTLFLVGVDHAGISTQLMVTRQLKKEDHKSPQDIGREAFTEKVWAWKNQYGGEITRQIRREGLSVDWSRERFTMDPQLSKAVREVFVRLYQEGWIYRGTRIVNWCPRDKTVLSDLEVKDEKAKDGKLWYLKYPVLDAGRVENAEARTSVRVKSELPESSTYITVATTRPETMLGDTAVAVNPTDERYKDLIGKTIALPLTNREIPIIADEYVESEFGTGAVKVTPAHDINDWEMGERHNLEKLVIMNDDATMNSNAGSDFEGLDRYVAREKVIERFEELGLLEKIEDYDVTLPHCERCKTIIEPLLSEQWFAKMDEMRDMALELVREKDLPHFYPEVPHKKVYTTWLENLRDWTISRQLWWGHQIPAWYDKQGNVYVARTAEGAYDQAGTTELTQDPDVLDTWFSSALWPFSTLGWIGSEPPAVAGGLTPAEIKSANAADLATFYPTDVLITGRDIIFLWVSRMVMTGLKFIGERPFDDVVVHGTVLDKNGQRMSKTKGNGIDPLDVFEKYGVDARAEALERELERRRVRLVPARLVAADDDLEQVLERHAREGEVDGRPPLRGDDPEPVAAVAQLGEHHVHPLADGDRVVQRLVVGAVDAHELVDALRVERLHLRLEARPADGGEQLLVAVGAAQDRLGGVAHRGEDDRARVDDGAVEVEEDDRVPHPV